MQRFVSLTSIAAPLPDVDIDTDVIFPARFLLLLNRQGLGQHLFHERRRSSAQERFVLDRPPFDKAQILVAGRNFGCGSSREQAVWALTDFGIRCVIAPSFGEIFFANCFRNGVLALRLADDLHGLVMSAALMESPLTVDLEVANYPTASRRVGRLSRRSASAPGAAARARSNRLHFSR